jgi:hypothetical protein
MRNRPTSFSLLSYSTRSTDSAHISVHPRLFAFLLEIATAGALFVYGGSAKAERKFLGLGVAGG